MLSPLEQFDAIMLFNYLNLKYIIDFSFFHTLMPLVLIILLWFFFMKFKKYFSLMFSTIFQSLSELKLIFVLNLMKQQMGMEGLKYIVLIFGIFFMMLYLNLLSIIPFGMALTSHLILIILLSLSICVGIFMEGYMTLGNNFYKVFLPSCSLFLLPLLLVMEIFSYIISMFSLSISLAANIMAGHTLIYIMSTFTLSILNLNFFFIIMGIILICVIMLLEFGVACLQAYVFTILVLMYLNDVYNGSH